MNVMLGTKGAKLTDMVQHIHSSFNELVENFKGTTPDLMDIRNKNFEDGMFVVVCENVFSPAPYFTFVHEVTKKASALSET